MKLYLYLVITLLVLAGCSQRPVPAPQKYKDALAFGALDLNISQRGEGTLFHSLGSAIKQKSTDREHTSEFNILALSGGGSRGAFGAGFIDGWSDSGKMPHFSVVTGISTGAIMAPFVFLEEKEELDKVEYFYTHVTTKEIFANRWFSFGNGYVASAKPLEEILDNLIDETFLEKIAQEHKKGRRLYVGTTNLDTGKFTVWDMGYIAASDKPDKLSRFKQIILASSALPVFVPPQYIQLHRDGKEYYQMHVDGGVYSQIFVAGLLEDWRHLLEIKQLQKSKVTLYLVANRKYRQRDYYEPVSQNLVDIVKAYVLTQMDLLFDKSSYRIYMAAKTKGYGFKMISIPNNMKPIIENPTQFEPDKTQELFNVGYNMGRNPQWKEHLDYDEYDKL